MIVLRKRNAQNVRFGDWRLEIRHPLFAIRSFTHSFIRLFAMAALLWQLMMPAALAQSPADDDPVANLLESMTVEEKIGQLFIVPFVGSDVAPGSDIHTLLTEYKIGGVVLQASNSNFANDENTPRQITALTNQLQAQTLANKNIPLFIAIDHEGDGYPYSRITGGVTPLPSPMTIGATWNTTNARDVGRIAGQELAAMGINLLLGPVLDVLNNPHPTGRGDMGTRTFGGDPFWVGEMGRAYIAGVHDGSNGTIATVAKHFPGHGGSDRLPDNEVATVDKSLQELRRIELSPFFAVTQPNTTGTTDAMMSSHIRYRGFQGDIRQFTAPISFDKMGMSTLLNLPEFIHWRDAGGIIISDALGVPAVRKFYDPTLQTFPHRRIARDAFLAGNDMLILAQFDLNNDWHQQFENIKDTVSFFRSEYRKDSNFAERVDESVTRILRLKFKLFPHPEPNSFTKDGDVALAIAGRGDRTVNAIAQQSLTLLYPTPDEYTARVPQTPGIRDKILIVSDSRMVRECFTDDCQPFEPLPHDALKNIILKLYGPDTTNQVSPENINAITFAELKQVLVGSLALANSTENSELPPLAHTPAEVTALIQQADWIIFAALDLNVDKFPDSDALKLFLAQGVNSLYDKKLIVLALNAPYYLDTTEISKLTAFWGLYSKTEPELEVAVRAIFGEMEPQGAPPVSVDGIGYDLPSVLTPDPTRPFRLSVTIAQSEPLRPPLEITAQAGPILDHNGHRVPDGTPVQFVATYADGQSVTAPITDTVGGYATISLKLSRAGAVKIAAYSGNAKNEKDVPLTLVESSAAAPTATPKPIPTATETIAPPTATAAPTAVITETFPLTNNSTAGENGQSAAEKLATRIALAPVDLLLALLAILLATAAGWLWMRTARVPLDILRWGLGAILGSLAIYIAVGMGWLNFGDWLSPTVTTGGLRAIFTGLMLVGGLIAAAGFGFSAGAINRRK